MGKVMKPYVTIKGTKDGLLFYFDDSCPYSEILEELTHKLEHNQALWEGPDTKIRIKLGSRQITNEEEQSLRDIFAQKKNLVIYGIESEGKPHLIESEMGITTLSGTVRSGQVLTHIGDLLFLGDVNPGGSIQASGSIYVMGALRGLAHAGMQGDERAIIAASVFKPTQLRVADVISRPPDEWTEFDSTMRFAHVVDGQISVERMNHFCQIRPDREWKEVQRSYRSL
ncbi:septum site-determining protein MinC [Baia soyae]|uniref:Probable septum site-determining protein MinC n=1 Tax=Baia soyae TaxID=1544746 RepID=A0A4R2S080_9BACL|nr:septum site-determining protein MinC [Baia soyae]TCP68567.1 septum site-determining protein MinC [Baia soyae]